MSTRRRKTLQRLLTLSASQDYLYHLAESVRELYPSVKDDYLFDLEVSKGFIAGCLF
jgi:hypothetical protein